MQFRHQEQLTLASQQANPRVMLMFGFKTCKHSFRLRGITIDRFGMIFTTPVSRIWGKRNIFFSFTSKKE